MKVAILTSSSSWFSDYVPELVGRLQENHAVDTFSHHSDIVDSYDVCFLLSYFNIVPEDFLRRNGRNLVVHESALPKGRGWAPVFWQILEGRNSIPVSLIEATAEADAGPICLQGSIELQGHELHDEIRKAQAGVTIELCVEYMSRTGSIQPRPQAGEPTTYPRRRPADSELDPARPLQDLFPQLRIASNTEYPAFFHHLGHKYVLSIRREGEEQA